MNTTTNIMDDTKQDGTLARRLGLLVSLSIAMIVIIIQPHAPWWLALDCDGSYLGCGLNLFGGRSSGYFDHPGMPLQTLMALTAACDHAVRWIGQPMSRYEYADMALANMADWFWMVRGWAAILFLLGAACAHEVARRLFGHWEWGVLATMLYVAVIGHFGRAVMYRPDIALSTLSLLVVFLLVRAVERRSIPTIVAALSLLGLAITVKVHAVGLLPAAGVALLMLRREDWPGQCRSLVVMAWQTHRRLILLSLLAYVVLLAVTNSWRPAPEVDWRLAGAYAAIVVLLLVTMYLAARRRPAGWLAVPRHPMWPLAAVVVLAGMILPGLLFADQVVMTLRFIFYAVTGRGVNSGFDPGRTLAAVWRQWQDPALLMQLPLLLLAALGAARRLARRDATTLIWVAGAGAMWALAALRAAVHPSPHHYAAAVTLCIPLILSALQPFALPNIASSIRPRPWASIAVLAVVIAPAVTALQATWWNRARCDVLAEVTERLTRRLRHDQFIMTDYWAQNAESGYFMQVRDWCDYTPAMDYRSLPDTPPALRYADAVGAHPAFYLTSGDQRTKITREDESGRLIAESIWGRRWYVRRLESHPLPSITIGCLRRRRRSPLSPDNRAIVD